MTRRTTFRATALAGLAVGLLAATPSMAQNSTDDQAGGGLQQALDTILDDARLHGARAGVVVRDLTTGDELYDRSGDERLVPASNTKLVTSAAAMEILGADYRFTTGVLHDGTRRGGVIDGDLYLRGTGDPTMLAADFDALAADVAAAGVTKVKGDLVADDTWFDDVRLGSDWAWDDEQYYYAPQISALTFAPDTDYDEGNVIVTVTPTREGRRPQVNLTPAGAAVPIENRAITGATGSENTVSLDRAHGSTAITVSGSVPEGDDPVAEWRTVWNPTRVAADLFRDALDRHGINVHGKTVRQSTPSDATPLASHDSMTLQELLVPWQKLSNNGIAESVTKAIGRAVSNEGTWEAGTAAIQATVADLGMDVDQQHQRDGSGLSRRNLFPPAELADLLTAARERPWFDAWYEALPIACGPERFIGGTLRSRMCETPAEGNVHAKTGSLSSVSALSGYVVDADGHELVFSIVLNNWIADSVKDLEDEIAITLASYSRSSGRSATTVIDVPMPTDVPADVECAWLKATGC